MSPLKQLQGDQTREYRRDIEMFYITLVVGDIN